MDTKMKKKNKEKNHYEIQFNGAIESNTTLRNQIKSNEIKSSIKKLRASP